MSNPQSEVDSKANLEKFIAQMNHGNSNNMSPGSGVSAQQQNGQATTNGQGSNDVALNSTTPSHIPGKSASSENTPTRTPAPTQVHPIASPHVSGLRAPQNTPHTRPSSPHIMPAHLRTHNEEVGLALSDFVNNMEDGKPLSESYWAPANVAARAAAALDSRPASRNLIPTNIVKPNPAINDTFDRMSFRAADFDSKVGNNIFGDRISRPATSVLGAKQTLGSPASSKSTVQPSIPVGAGPSGQSSNISITKAANWVNRTLSKASGSAVKNSQKAIPAPQDDGLVSRLSALECFGRLDPGQINFLKDITNKVVADKAQPTTATTSAQAVAEKPTGNTADKSAKANGVQVTVEESTGRIFVGNAEQVEALVKKLSLKEKELKALKEITELRESLCLKEEEWKNFNAVWEEKENKLQKDVTELQAELARVEDLISLKQRESVALSASNAGRGVVMTKAIQDMRHELHLKEEKFNDADALSARKQAGLEKEVKELQKELQRMEATKKEKSKVEVSLKAVESAKDEGILEHKTFFNAWPLSEKRDRAPAQIRKVILKNLPANATLSFVASIVYFGPVEEIFMRSDNSATVKFLKPADCTKYYKDTSNGVVYKKDIHGHEMVVFVELAKDVDVIGGILQRWIEDGVSRCVRTVGVDEDWDMAAFIRLASAKNRIVEGIADGMTHGGSRVVVFRFAKIDHAFSFRAMLARDDHWDHVNVHFAMDPCEIAKSIHFEN